MIKQAIGPEDKDLQVGYRPAILKGDDFGNISISEMSDARSNDENVDKNQMI